MLAQSPILDRRSLDEATLLIPEEARSVVTVETTGHPRKTVPEDALTGAIFERCIIDAPLVDRHSCLRKIALTVSVITSLSAGASFIPISLQLPAGYLFAAANFIGFFKLDIWAIRGTIDDLLGPRSEKEIVLLDRASTGTWFKGAVIAASTVIALLSQVPVALPALDYDGSLGIPAAASLVVGGLLLPIRSLQLSISKTIRAWHSNAGEAKEIEKLRETMGSMIDQRRDLFRTMGHAGQLEQVHRFKNLQEEQFIAAALEPPSEVQEPLGLLLSSRIARVVGVWIAGSLQTGLALYTFAKTKEHIIDSNAAAGVLAGAVVLSGVYLSGKSILDTTERITDSFFGMIRGQRENTLAEQLRPKLTRSLKLLGLAIDLGALGATTVIWGEFYQNNLPLRAYFETTLCLAYFLFLSTSTLDMVNEVVEEIVQHKGSQEEQDILELNCKLKKMQKLIEGSHASDLAVFIQQCPAQLKTSLLEKIGLSTERLDALGYTQQADNA